MTKKEQSEQNEARETLRKIFPPGSTAYTILRSCSRSGMSRVIAVVAKTDDGIRDVSWLVGRACGMRYDGQREGVKIGGCGMDMGFHVVYTLSYYLNPEGFGCVGEGCSSNDHSNGDRDYTPHGHRGPHYVGTKESLKHWHSDGGYALKHRWI